MGCECCLPAFQNLSIKTQQSYRSEDAIVLTAFPDKTIHAQTILHLHYTLAAGTVQITLKSEILAADIYIVALILEINRIQTKQRR